MAKKETILVIFIMVTAIAMGVIIWGLVGNNGKHDTKNQDYSEQISHKQNNEDEQQSNGAQENKTIRQGTFYLVERNGQHDSPMGPDGEYISLTIGEDNSYSFFTSMYSSYLNYGTYEIDGSTLICTTDDHTKQYCFNIISSENLEFLVDESSNPDSYGEEYELQDRDKFVLEEK